jgi:hypothetical protein
MQFSSQVDFSRRYGKSIGIINKQFNYEFKNKLEKLTDKEKRKLFCENLDELIKYDSLLCIWLYYYDYEKFIAEFKNYVMIMDEEEFNLIIESSIILENVMDNFWLESNDPKLKSDYVYEDALKEYINRVERNGYKYDNDEKKDKNFKVLLKNIYYRINNETLFKKNFKMTQEFKNARIDDILQMRTKEEWEILYALRYSYKNVINELLNNKSNNAFDPEISKYRLDLDSTLKPNIVDTDYLSELYKNKKKYEDFLMLYQETIEGLDWHNPYSNETIDSLEYFPRETSKPTNEWAYASYYDLENTAQKIVENMIATRKRKREERENEFNKRWKRLEEKNNKINTFIKYTKNGLYYGTRLSLIIAVSAIVYAYFI